MSPIRTTAVSLILVLSTGALSAYASTFTRGEIGMREFEAAMSREKQGFRNEVYSKYYDALLEGLKKADPDGQIHPFMFLRSQRAIVNRARIAQEEGPFLSGARGVKFPVGMFKVFHDQIRAAFMKRISMPPAMAEAFATQMEKEAIELAGINGAEYLAAIREPRPDVRAQITQFQQAIEFCFRLSTIDPSFNVPYVAGYDKNDGHYVFIDRSIPREVTKNGVYMPVFKFLNVHELVEKALLDEYELTYQSAHQIAQRSERAVAASISVPWAIYDGVISEAADVMDARPITRVSDRLDLQPYFSYVDKDNVKLVREMKAKTVEHEAFARPIGKPRE